MAGNKRGAAALRQPPRKDELSDLREDGLDQLFGNGDGAAEDRHGLRSALFDEFRLARLELRRHKKKRLRLHRRVNAAGQRVGIISAGRDADTVPIENVFIGLVDLEVGVIARGAEKSFRCYAVFFQRGLRRIRNGDVSAEDGASGDRLRFFRLVFQIIFRIEESAVFRDVEDGRAFDGRHGADGQRIRVIVRRRKEVFFDFFSVGFSERLELSAMATAVL